MGVTQSIDIGTFGTNVGTGSCNVGTNYINGKLIEFSKVDHLANWSLLFVIASVSTILILILFAICFKNPSPAEQRE